MMPCSMGGGISVCEPTSCEAPGKTTLVLTPTCSVEAVLPCGIRDKELRGTSLAFYVGHALRNYKVQDSARPGIGLRKRHLLAQKSP